MNYRETSNRISFSDTTTISRDSFDSDDEFMNALQSNGFGSAYVTEFDTEQYMGQWHQILGTTVSDVVNTNATGGSFSENFYKMKSVGFVGGGTYADDMSVKYDRYYFEPNGTRTENVQGDYIDQVTSSSSSAYPSDGQSGSYWYVSAGSTTSKGSANGSVTSTNSSAYPADGVSGSYWYTSSESTQQAGSVLGVVESYDSSAYPDNGILDGYWYVKQ